MASPVRFEVEAEHELDDAAQMYEEQRPGLGKRFLQEVAVTSERVRQFPRAGAPVKHVPAELGVDMLRSKAFHIMSFIWTSGTKSGSSQSLTTGDGPGTGSIGEMVIPRGT